MFVVTLRSCAIVPELLTMWFVPRAVPRCGCEASHMHLGCFGISALFWDF